MNSERERQITSIFHSAIGREPHERGPYLDGACGDDEALRREVEELIKSHESGGSFIASPAYEQGAELLSGGGAAQKRPGQSIGPYKIISLVGAGGMGEVYRAHDSRLGREVALKLLPASLSQGEESVRRFQQEARAASALNHPNILSIYDTGATDDGTPYLVSELLEGETLREKLARGALPSRKAVDYALQTARGLAAAHGKGIVHRDLKPDNLFVTKDGRLKILDFGIAKLIPRNAMRGELHTEAPTMMVHTDPGMVVGTAGYMSPEQVRGQNVDTRSDIFSFGAILYEALSGRRAFHGESHVETMNAILKEDPAELSSTNSQISPAVERVVRRCLEKEPDERFQSASDLAFALDSLSGVQTSGATVAVQTAEAPRPTRRRWLRERLGWIVAALLLVATLAFAALYFRKTVLQAEIVRFALPMPDKGTFSGSLALSPNGRHLAFAVKGSGGMESLWLRDLDTVSVRELPGTEGATHPFWSPDSRFLAFFAGNKLKKIDIAGGPTQILAEVSAEARGGAWGPDGTILFGPGFTQPLYKVPAAGGKAEPATKLDESRNINSHRWPWFLPDGRNFLYFARSTRKDVEGLYVGSLDTKEEKLLLNTNLLAAVVPPASGDKLGQLLFMRDRTLVAQPFDTGKFQLSGEAVVVAENLLTYPSEGGPTAYAAFSVSTNGHLSFMSGDATQDEMGWFDRAGNPLGKLGASGLYYEPWPSPDSKRIAVGRVDAGGDIWIYDVARGTASRFTFDPAADVCPVWSPDGSRIVFASVRRGTFGIYQKPSSGAGSEELLLQTDYNAFPTSWSSDGNFVIYETEDAKNRYDIYVLPMSGERKPFPYIKTEFNENHPQFSPDGKWVAYVSDEAGRSEVYVQGFPTSGGKWQVSTGGGDQPQWRRDGKELFYITPDKKLMAVSVTTGTTFESSAPVELFATRVGYIGQTDDRNHYFSVPDGQRFLVINNVEQGKSQVVTVVLNWNANLKR